MTAGGRLAGRFGQAVRLLQQARSGAGYSGILAASSGTTNVTAPTKKGRRRTSSQESGGGGGGRRRVTALEPAATCEPWLAATILPRRPRTCFGSLLLSCLAPGRGLSSAVRMMCVVVSISDDDAYSGPTWTAADAAALGFDSFTPPGKTVAEPIGLPEAWCELLLTRVRACVHER